MNGYENKNLPQNVNKLLEKEEEELEQTFFLIKTTKQLLSK